MGISFDLIIIIDQFGFLNLFIMIVSLNMRNGCPHLLSILLSKEIAEVYNLIIFQLL